MDIPVRSIECPEPRPDSLLTEHVEAIAPGPATDYVEGEYQQAGWWIVTRFAGSAVLVVTTPGPGAGRADPRLRPRWRTSRHPARRPARWPVRSAPGPSTAAPLDDVSAVDWVAVCQYEPVLDQADVALPRLRAAVGAAGLGRRGAGGAAALRPRARDQLRPGARGRPARSRDPGPDRHAAMAYARSTSPPPVVRTANPAWPAASTTATAVRVLTRPACQALLLPPLTCCSAPAARSARTASADPSSRYCPTHGRRLDQAAAIAAWLCSAPAATWAEPASAAGGGVRLRADIVLIHSRKSAKTG